MTSTTAATQFSPTRVRIALRLIAGWEEEMVRIEMLSPVTGRRNDIEDGRLFRMIELRKLIRQTKAELAA